MKLTVVVVAALSARESLAFVPSFNPVRSTSTTAAAQGNMCTVRMAAGADQGASEMSSVPMGRKQMLQSTAAAAFGAAFVSANPSQSFADSSVDYKKVRADIEGIIDKDGSKGPTLVRLAWHSSGTYDKISRTGGSQGGTMRFAQELADGANAGLNNAVGWLEPIKKKYPAMSYGDLYTLAGVTAIEKMGGPTIKWRSGRKDDDVAAVPPGGRLPAADKGNPMATAKGLRDVFYRMGFNDREIVALSGAHALGRCHTDASGYDGPWTPTPNLFTGATYFKLLKSIPWSERKNFTPFQYQDPSGTLMMLPSDIVLLEDKSFKKYVDMYADNDKLFFEDFSKAFSTLLELGTKDLVEESA
ncbi:unnamed protein product [Ectocarpus sp. 4 AP-2014]